MNGSTGLSAGSWDSLLIPLFNHCQTSHVPLTLTPCVSLADCLALNNFLRAAVGNSRSLHTWEPRRWEGLLFHRNSADLIQTRAQVAQQVVIARRDAVVVGAVTPEYPGGVHIQAIAGDVEAMTALIDWATANLEQPNNAGGRWLEIWCRDDDQLRADLLTARGFQPTSEHQLSRSQDLSSAEIGEHPLAEGYTLRGIESESDYALMAQLLNASFDRDFHSAEEYANFAALSPSYRADLQLVAIAPDGSFAAHAGFTAHAEESFAVVEPVCTHPDHQGLGLAQAVMAVGLRQLQAEGIRTAFIEAWYANPVSNHVYERMGFRSPIANRIWRRER